MAFKVRQTPPPVSGQSVPQPTFEGVQQQIDQARYPSQLRGKKLGPEMARLLMGGEITLEEFDSTMEKVEDKRQSMRPSISEPPEGPPASVVMPAEPGTPEWSPTAILATLPSAEDREFDARERAAGEHLDRD